MSLNPRMVEYSVYATIKGGASRGRTREKNQVMLRASLFISIGCLHDVLEEIS